MKNKHINFDMKTGNINKPTYIFWSKITLELNYLIIPNYVFTILFLNRNNISKLKCDEENEYMKDQDVDSQEYDSIDILG